MLKRLSFLFIFYFLFSYQAIALDNLQFSFRTGLVNGSYSNPLQEGDEEAQGNVSSDLENGGFSVVPSMDFELELFEHSRKSYLARTIIAMDLSSGKMNYNYLGVGFRNYIRGIGIPRIFVGKDQYIKTIPKRKMYYGYDLGLSRVSVVSFGSVLSAVSTGIDFGGHFGYTQQMGTNWGFNAQTGLSYAYGISNVSASGINIKMLFGISYSL